MGETFKAIPILRIFDKARAREFYLDFLASRSTGSIASRTTRRSTWRSRAAIWCCI
jgi:hypothetical protein